MAQYKVLQDVEADDKLLGPFSFRQFVYLMIAGALIALAVGLFQLFPLLAIIPVVPAFFFLALALPLKKDQPMETYLAAILSYHMKPHTRKWMPGQRGVTIEIMAPKKVEPTRTRDITGEEATHRLSFLADIVDSEGYAIKGINTTPMREDLMAEASTAVDMFEGTRFNNLASTIQKEEIERHAEVMRQMKATIQEVEGAPLGVPLGAGADEGFADAMAATGYANGGAGNATVAVGATPQVKKHSKERKQSDAVVVPEVHKVEKKYTNRVAAGSVVADAENAEIGPVEKSVENSEENSEGKGARGEDEVGKLSGERGDVRFEGNEKKLKSEGGIRAEKMEIEKAGSEKAEAEKSEKSATKAPKPSIIELANNDALSVATIAKEAKRIKRKEEGEVFISLH